MCNRLPIFAINMVTMHPTFARLVEAAEHLKNWTSAAQIARGLTAAGFESSEQSLSNWKRRGVSHKGIVECSRIIGCRMEYLETGTAPMKREKNGRVVAAAFSPDEETLLEGFRLASPRERESMLYVARLVIHDFHKRRETN